MGVFILVSMQVTTLALALVVVVLTVWTPLAVCGECGPPECGVECDDCVEDPTITCCCEPCCARWSCGCPDTRPGFNTPCQAGQEGLECEFGSQECCGVEYPEVILQCEDSTWVGYYVDTLCILGLAPPCPDDTTTTTVLTTTPPSSCPPDWPDQDSACVPGLRCPYGEEECCGDLVPDIVYECHGGQWDITIIDSLCDIGLPCPTTLKL